MVNFAQSRVGGGKKSAQTGSAGLWWQAGVGAVERRGGDGGREIRTCGMWCMGAKAARVSGKKREPVFTTAGGLTTMNAEG